MFQAELPIIMSSIWKLDIGALVSATFQMLSRSEATDKVQLFS